MSTAYYYVPSPPCECCKRSFNENFIGSSAGGWRFSLAASSRLDTWAEIKERLLVAYRIYNEYDVTLTAAEMIAVVERDGGRAHCDEYPKDSWRDPEGFVMIEGEWS